MNKRVEIITHPDGLVSAGDYTSKSPSGAMYDTYSLSHAKYKSHIRTWIDLCCKVTGIAKDCMSIKERNKLLTEKLGCTPVAFTKVWNATVLSAHIPEDLRNVAAEFCRGSGGKYKKTRVDTLIKTKKLVLQCLADGMNNIIPIIIALNTPQIDPLYCDISHIKAVCSKKTWKTIANNSKTKNMHMSNLIIAQASINFSDSLEFFAALPFSILRSLNSGDGWRARMLLRTHREQPLAAKTWVNLLKNNKCMGVAYNHLPQLHMLRDTFNQRQDLGLTPFVWKDIKSWTVSNWTNKHNKYTKQLNLRKYNKDNIKWLDQFPKHCTYGDWEATLLKSEYDIMEEGMHMHHCVAQYASRVTNKTYMVWSIKYKGKRYSTLGCERYLGQARETLSLPNDQYITIDQHYAAHNKPVSDEANQFVCEEVRTHYQRIVPRANFIMNASMIPLRNNYYE